MLLLSFLRSGNAFFTYVVDVTSSSVPQSGTILQFPLSQMEIKREMRLRF